MMKMNASMTRYQVGSGRMGKMARNGREINGGETEGLLGGGEENLNRRGFGGGIVRVVHRRICDRVEAALLGNDGGGGSMAVAAALDRRPQLQHNSGDHCITRSRQGEVATLSAGTAAARRRAAAAAAETAVGLLPRSSLSKHLRGSSLLFSSNDG